MSLVTEAYLLDRIDHALSLVVVQQSLDHVVAVVVADAAHQLLAIRQVLAERLDEGVHLLLDERLHDVRAVLLV